MPRVWFAVIVASWGLICFAAAGAAPASSKSPRPPAICNSVGKCNYVNPKDINAALQSHTASFKVIVEGGGGGGDGGGSGGGGGDYSYDYYDDDYGGGGGGGDGDDAGGGGGVTEARCQITELVNRIGAVSWGCLTTDSGAALASVGCAGGMRAVSVSCVHSLVGLFIPVLGATGAVHGDSAVCAFPPRDLVSAEWSSLPYAILLTCENSQVPLDSAGRAKAISAADAAAANAAAAAPGPGASATSGPTPAATSSLSDAPRQPMTMLRVVKKKRAGSKKSG